MKHELWYSVVVRDRHGKVVSRERRKSHSFLKAWNQLIYLQMASIAGYNITDTGGVARSCEYGDQNFIIKAAAGVTDYGIRVGTGNTAVAIDDYALETPIAEGTGGGQMEHLACSVDDFIVTPPSCAFIAHRTISNNSGGLIDVLEAAIYVRMQTGFYGCGVRDVLTVPQAVPDGGAITIDWAIGVTV